MIIFYFIDKYTIMSKFDNENGGGGTGEMSNMRNR